MGRAKSTYDNVETKKPDFSPHGYIVLAVNVATGHSRSQQTEVQPRLAAQVNSAVSLDTTRMVNITLSHHFFCSSWYMTKHMSHTCGRRSCRPARYLSSSTNSQISKRCLATALRVSSWITTGHYVIDRRGSKASGFRRQCHEGSTTSSHLMTPLVLLHQHLRYQAVFVFFMNLLFCVWRRSVLFLGSWL